MEKPLLYLTKLLSKMIAQFHNYIPIEQLRTTLLVMEDQSYVKPFYVRRLTRTEQAHIRKLRNRPPNLDVYRRAQAVHFSSQRLKVQRIAEMVSRNRTTVTRWLHEFNTHGPDVLGLYSRAYQILMLPISNIRGPLSHVAIPALSRLQKNPRQYKRYYHKLVSLVAFISMPLMVYLGVCSDNVIRSLLGEKWMGVSSIFMILAISAFIQPVAGTRGLVLISLCQSRRYLNFGIFHGVVVVTFFVVGLPWGAIGVAVSYAIANYLILFPSLWYCFRQTPLEVATFLKAVMRPTIASLTMGVAAYLVHLSLTDQSDILTIVVCLVVSWLAYLLTWVLMPRGVEFLREFFNDFALVLSKRKISPAAS